MKTPLLTYIVPVYNTAEWLRDCITSLLSHKSEDVEYVIIDDGSTDGSSEILDKFTESDHRIKVFHQENRGLSDARNEGLRHACGQYILFVDSDDTVDANAVAKMLEVAVNAGADVITGHISCIFPDGATSPWGAFLPSAVYASGIDFMEAIASNSKYFPMVFGYMVRRELLIDNEILFIPDLIHEDELWTPQVLSRTGKSIATSFCHYRYRVSRTGSIMSTNNNFERCISLAQIIAILLSEATRSGKALKFYYDRISTLTSVIIRLATDSQSLTLVKDLACGHLLEYSRFMQNKKTLSL